MLRILAATSLALSSGCIGPEPTGFTVPGPTDCGSDATNPDVLFNLAGTDFSGWLVDYNVPVYINAPRVSLLSGQLQEMRWSRGTRSTSFRWILTPPADPMTPIQLQLEYQCPGEPRLWATASIDQETHVVDWRVTPPMGLSDELPDLERL